MPVPMDEGDDVDDYTPGSARIRIRPWRDDEINDGSVRKHIRLSASLALQSRVSDHHDPLKWPSNKKVVDAEGNITFEDQRPHCKLCSKRCSYSCDNPNFRVGLCLDSRTDCAASCWKVYHAD